MTLDDYSLPKWLIDCTVQGSVAIVAVAILGPLVRRWLGAQAAYLFWAIVLLRLLVPWLPASPVHWESPSFSAAAALRPLPVSQVKITTTLAAGRPPELKSPAAASEGSVPAAAKDEAVGQSWSWPFAALALWIAGVMASLGCAWLCMVRASRLARRAREITIDPHLISLFDLTAARARLRIKETGELRSPALTGVLRPTILLPLDWRERLTPSQLAFVLAHELGHFRRGDLLWRWMFLIARSVHWFNPLVWMAERLARTDQEMACDEWVLTQGRGAFDPQLYGEALLASARRPRVPDFAFPVQAGMAESRRGLKRRMRNLGNVRSHGASALAMALFLSVALLVVTGSARSDASATTLNSFPESSPVSASVHHEPQSTLEPEPNPAPRTGAKTVTSVKIETKFVELPMDLAADLLGDADLEFPDPSLEMRAIYSPKQYQGLLRRLDQTKGADIMSTPNLLAPIGLRSALSIVRNFRYPDQFEQAANGSVTPSSFGNRNLGVTLEVLPTKIQTGGILLYFFPEVVDFGGFINFGGRRATKEDLRGDSTKDSYEPSALGVVNQPLFEVRHLQTSIVLQDGETVVLGGMTRDDVSKVVDDTTGKSLPDQHVLRALYVFVTATLSDARGGPNHRSSATLSQPSAPPLKPAPLVMSKDGFYAVPVPNKPGFVTSPYAPGAGFVDVRGFSANTEVKDPYTGQIFLVPASGQAAPMEPPPDPGTPLGEAQRMIIPSIEFKDASLSDAMSALRNKSAELDDESDSTKRGLNLMLKLPGQLKADRKITAKLTDISLFEALRFVAATNDLVVVDEANGLSIQPLEVGPLITRKYQVPAQFLSALQATKPSDLKSFWRAHGMDFPPGAFASFNRPSELVVRDTKEEHEKLQRLFAEPAAPPKVEASPLKPSPPVKADESFYRKAAPDSDFQF